MERTELGSILIPLFHVKSCFLLDPLDLAAIHSQQTLGNALAILPRLARFCAYRQSAGNDAFAQAQHRF
jgi:hypothetical protein